MDRVEALRLLRGGEEEVREWNRRRAAVEEIPHLVGAKLRRADLSGADLSWTYLSRANLSRANLSGADLSGADLSWTYLSRANLSGANLSGADLSLARLIRCKLDDAIFDEADVTACHVQETIGRPKPPRLLRFKDRSPLTGEDAWNFFWPSRILGRGETC